jgi:hypothetical protein
LGLENAHLLKSFVGGGVVVTDFKSLQRFGFWSIRANYRILA